MAAANQRKRRLVICEADDISFRVNTFKNGVKKKNEDETEKATKKDEMRENRPCMCEYIERIEVFVRADELILPHSLFYTVFFARPACCTDVSERASVTIRCDAHILCRYEYVIHQVIITHIIIWSFEATSFEQARKQKRSADGWRWQR